MHFYTYVLYLFIIIVKVTIWIQNTNIWQMSIAFYGNNIIFNI